MPISESTSENGKRNVNLYLDDATRETLEGEAHDVGLSFSAYLRVMGRVFREKRRVTFDTTMESIRARVQEIVDEESRRV